MRSNRGVLTVAGLMSALALLIACSTTTSGSGRASTPQTSASTPGFPSTTQAETTAASTPPASESAATGGPTVIPPPDTPLKTVTVHAPDGKTYVVKIWADVKNDTCFDHAYGAPMITFLTQHPCFGLRRYLGTTTVGGRPVGFAESSTGFPGTPKDLYGEAGKFAQLEQQDGTGSINDLLREGYRLPSGPTSVPSSEAFNVLGQDQGVTVWDVWYLDGGTPNNDPALIKMTQDLFLQF